MVFVSVNTGETIIAKTLSCAMILLEVSLTKAVLKRDQFHCVTVQTIVRVIFCHGARLKTELDTFRCVPTVVALLVIPGNPEIELLTYEIPTGSVSSK